MNVSFVKTSHERHDLRCLRDGGTATEARGLETRSLLRHDFMHYCVEKRGDLRDSFFGSVAAGADLGKAFSMGERDDAHAQARTTEIVVAILQGADRQPLEPRLAKETILAAVTSQELPLPSYLTEEFITATCKDYRFLLKRWNSLKTGETLEVGFP